MSWVWRRSAFYSRRALAIKVKLLGHRHRDIAMTLNNLGIFYLSRRRLKFCLNPAWALLAARRAW